VLVLVATFIVLLPEPPVIEPGLNVAVAPVGSPSTRKLTVPLKFPDGVTVTA
jgi:hypothetical protein